MPTAWRIVVQKHTDTAFSGEGAAKFGGRWNSKGVPVVYTSATQSLAALEILVHLVPSPPLIYRVLSVEFDDQLMEKVPLHKLPSDWQDDPVTSGTRAIGDKWAKSGKSAILEVPSVLIPSENNYLLNPEHP